ncbi:MAG: glucose-phosphate cytidylyltransferase [Actinomycetota bacterium]|nr:glucose-phosphate cytidylyltransferase [Actinomycetota bacterium]
MKVVIFCGGLGLRMRNDIDSAPKPMMSIGDRPVLWHIMRYYAHFGHTEFILCLGYGASTVKDYFLHYDETRSNDFILSKGGQNVQLLRSDISDWQVSFIETGIETSIGERLRRVRHLLDGDDVFLANYGDVLTDAPMDEIVTDFLAGGATASLLAVPPQASFHVLEIGEDARVDRIDTVASLPIWMNGGYFVMRQGVFDVLDEDEDLVEDAFRRLSETGRLTAVRYTGFWAPMDTLKERAVLERLDASGKAPWKVWRRTGEHPGNRSARLVLEGTS